MFLSFSACAASGSAWRTRSMCSALAVRRRSTSTPGSWPVALATATGDARALGDLARVGADRDGLLGDGEAAAAAVDDLAARGVQHDAWCGAGRARARRRPGGRRPAAARRGPARRAGRAPSGRIRTRMRRGVDGSTAAADRGALAGRPALTARRCGAAGRCGRRRSAGGPCRGASAAASTRPSARLRSMAARRFADWLSTARTSRRTSPDAMLARSAATCSATMPHSSSADEPTTTRPLGSDATRPGGGGALRVAGGLRGGAGAPATGRGSAVAARLVTGARSSVRSATRRRADAARGFSSDSAAPGRTTRGVSTRSSGSRPQPQTGRSGGQMQPAAASRRKCLTMRSSSEWNEMTAMRPPGRSTSSAWSRPSARARRARR